MVIRGASRLIRPFRLRRPAAFFLARVNFQRCCCLPVNPRDWCWLLFSISHVRSWMSTRAAADQYSGVCTVVRQRRAAESAKIVHRCQKSVRRSICHMCVCVLMCASRRKRGVLWTRVCFATGPDPETPFTIILAITFHRRAIFGEVRALLRGAYLLIPRIAARGLEIERGNGKVIN